MPFYLSLEKLTVQRVLALPRQPGNDPAFCFTRENGNLTEEKFCFPRPEEIWREWEERVIQGDNSPLLITQNHEGEEAVYQITERGAFGFTAKIQKIIKGENGLVPDSNEPPREVFLFTAQVRNYPEEPYRPITFVVPCKMPKAMGELKSTIEPVLDIVEGKIYFFPIDPENGEISVNTPALGYYNLETGEWFFSEGRSIHDVFEITPPKEILQIEGLELKYNVEKGVWEYHDPEDGLVAGFWNAKEERFELTASVLRVEWKGLYVKTSPQKAQEIFEESIRENSNHPKVVLPIEMRKYNRGELKEDIVTTFGRKDKVIHGRNFPKGTELRAPFGGQTECGALSNGKNTFFESIVFFPLPLSNLYFYIDFQESEENREFIKHPPTSVKAGHILGKVSSRAPFCRDIDTTAQFEFSFANLNTVEIKIDFSSLARDEKGRILTL